MTKASPSLGHEAEIDPLISQHGLARKIKGKNEEIAKTRKLNRLLQEQVKSLLWKNRIWRGLAQDNEAEADSLRSTLQHLLGGGGGGVNDAGSSCCGSSNDPGREGTAEMRRRNGGACTCVCRGVCAPVSVLVVVVAVRRSLG